MSDKELDVDELIDIANSSDEPVDFGEMTEALRFVEEFGIKEGDTRIPTFIIYKTYKDSLTPARRRNIQHKTMFMRDFAKLFKPKRTTNYRYYLLDPEPFDLSDEYYWETRKDVRRERDGWKKKKEDKKK